MIYEPPGFLGGFDACADSVYQALFSPPPPLKGPGDEANGAIAGPFMERKLQNNPEKSRICEKKASYRNLQVRNLEKLA